MTTYAHARWTPRVSVVGILGGIVGAFGVVVLLQQYGRAYPTRSLLVVALAMGAITGVALPSLGRLYAVHRWNAYHSGQTSGAPAVTAAAAAPMVVAYRLPAEPTAAWREPAGDATPDRYLDPSLDIALLERRGDWAHVQVPSGEDLWVDGRRIEQRAA